MSRPTPGALRAAASVLAWHEAAIGYDYSPDRSRSDVARIIDRETAVSDLLAALEIAQLYLAKAVADDLMSNCVRSPAAALRVVNDAIAKANGELSI